MRLGPTLIATLIIGLSAAPAMAALRVPQVPVVGSALQSLLDSMHAQVDAHADQIDRPVWQDLHPIDGVSNWLVDWVPQASGASVSVGLYAPGDPARSRYELLPDNAGPQWFAAFGFRRSPTRLVVSIFNEQAQLVRSTQYLGIPESALGFYLKSVDTVLYSEDTLNPGGAPQWLAYFGSGIDAGNFWLAAETTPLASGSSDRDYDDVVLFLQPSQCNCTPTQRTTWGALKQRFR